MINLAVDHAVSDPDTSTIVGIVAVALFVLVAAWIINKIRNVGKRR